MEQSSSSSQVWQMPSMLHLSPFSQSTSRLQYKRHLFVGTSQNCPGPQSIDSLHSAQACVVLEQAG